MLQTTWKRSGVDGIMTHQVNNVLFLSYMFISRAFVIYRTQYLLVSHFPLVISLNLMRVKVLFNRQ